MQRLASRGTVSEVISQRKRSAQECDLIPRHLALFDQLDLETLRSHAKTRLEQSRTKEDVHLAGAQRVKDGEQRADLDGRFGLFDGLACSSLHQGFVVLHEARRDRPEAAARFDRATADENPAFPFRYAAGHELRILVMDGSATVTDKAWQVITGRNLETDALPAVAAEVHAGLGVSLMEVVLDAHPEGDVGHIEEFESLHCLVLNVCGNAVAQLRRHADGEHEE